jgi:hypothetical protein
MLKLTPGLLLTDAGGTDAGGTDAGGTDDGGTNAGATDAGSSGHDRASSRGLHMLHTAVPSASNQA